MTILLRAHVFALSIGYASSFFVKNDIGQTDGVVSKQDKPLVLSPRELSGFQ